MNKLQAATLAVTVSLLIAINLPAALPRVYKAARRSVGPDVVAVYVPNPNADEQPVPILDSGTHNTNTGQRVAVYLRNDFRDDELQRTPRSTIDILLAAALVYFGLTRISKLTASSI